MSETTTPPATPPPATRWIDHETAGLIVSEYAGLVGTLATMARRLDLRLAAIEQHLQVVSREQLAEADAVARTRHAAAVEAERAASAIVAAEAAKAAAVRAADVESSQAQARQEVAVAELRTDAVDAVRSGVRAVGAGANAVGGALQTKTARWIILAGLSGLAGLGAGEAGIIDALRAATEAAITLQESHGQPPLPPPE